MMSRVTKKHINELLALINENGYWSEEVKNYNSQFSYNSMVRLQQKVNIILRSETV